MEDFEEIKLERLREKAKEGSVTAIQIIEKKELEAKLDQKKQELLTGAQYGRPKMMIDELTDVPKLNTGKSAVDLLRDLDISEIETYIRRGEFKTLPEHMSVYVTWMELAHDWYYKFKDKNWIIKYLMSVCKDENDYAISYYLANKIFIDMLSFFYSDKDFKKNSWFLYLAERLVMGASMAWELNDFETYGKNMDRAAAIIDKVTVEKVNVDPRLLERRPRYFFTNAEELGAPKIDRNALAKSIDEMPIPEKVKIRAKQDLGIVKRDLMDEETLKGEIEETK
jgi:hypothetical protein